MKKILYTLLFILFFLGLNAQPVVTFNGCNTTGSNLFEASFEVENVSDSADVLRFLIVDTSQVQILYNDSIQNPNSSSRYLFGNYSLDGLAHYSAIAYTETFSTGNTNIFYLFEFDCPSPTQTVDTISKEVYFNVYQKDNSVYIQTSSQKEMNEVKIYDYIGNQYQMTQQWGKTGSHFLAEFVPMKNGIYIFYNPLSGTSRKVIFSEF